MDVGGPLGGGTLGAELDPEKGGSTGEELGPVEIGTLGAELGAVLNGTETELELGWNTGEPGVLEETPTLDDGGGGYGP